MTDTVPEPHRWGISNDYGPLKDVLVGTPEFYRWIDAGPITMRTLNNQERTGVQFNLQTAMSQHAEMVSIFESNGVNCHYLDADEVLHRNFFARDSSVMTPWGAIICHMQLKSRRAPPDCAAIGNEWSSAKKKGDPEGPPDSRTCPAY